MLALLVQYVATVRCVTHVIKFTQGITLQKNVTTTLQRQKYCFVTIFYMGESPWRDGRGAHLLCDP